MPLLEASVSRSPEHSRLQMKSQSAMTPRHWATRRAHEWLDDAPAFGVGTGSQPWADQYAPRRLSTAGTVCSSSLMSQLRLQPVTYM